MKVQLEHTKPDGLTREVWTFMAITDYSNTFTITNDLYEVQHRATRRHKWTTSSRWPAAPRGGRYDRASACDKPEVTDELRAEVVAKLVEAIEWKDRP